MAVAIAMEIRLGLGISRLDSVGARRAATQRMLHIRLDAALNAAIWHAPLAMPLGVFETSGGLPYKIPSKSTHPQFAYYQVPQLRRSTEVYEVSNLHDSTHDNDHPTTIKIFFDSSSILIPEQQFRSLESWNVL